MSAELDPCGCCESPDLDDHVHNPPGLAALAYRVGTHGTFLRRMLAQLPIQLVEGASGGHRPLARLSARTGDDPAIALLDAWATVGDILTFYTERIANEGYLGTATERRSVLELARLIGYELNPGVAASTSLAFRLDASPGAPTRAVVARGTKVQSVPGQDELPQTFETDADVDARVELNELRPRRLRPQELAIVDGSLRLLAVSAGVGADAAPVEVSDVSPLDLAVALPSAGTVDAVEVDTIYVEGTSTNLTPGSVLLLAGRGADASTTTTLVRTVGQVVEEPDLDRTRVVFEARVATRAGFSPLRFDAATLAITAVSQDAGTVSDLVAGHSWTDTSLATWMAVQGWNVTAALGFLHGAFVAPRPPPGEPGDPGVFAMRTKLGFFGHNAPRYASLTTTVQSAFVDWDSGLSIWRDSADAEHDPPGYYDDADAFLERTVDGIVANSWAVLERPTRQYTPLRVTAAAESSVAGYALSAKATGLQLGRADTGAELADDTTDKSESFSVRRTTAHVRSERLVLAQLPITDPVGAGTAEQMRMTLEGMVLGVESGRPVAFTGERDDLPGVTVSEIVLVASAEHSGGFTTWTFAAPGLTHRYVRSTVTINANVASATHGETVTEVLGSGNAARPNQRFTLKKPPLTHVPATGASGAASTLEVRVDGVRWQQVDQLYGAGPADEVHEVRIDDDARATVTFGDGEQGARVPSGVENVVATYRSGIGVAGMVPAGALTLLMTRPLGVREVTNPLGATGAADPESLADARRNAPLTVLAMGRIVSLRDVEDFARAFAGVGKAGVVALWRDRVQWAHLTVASAAPVPDPQDLAAGLPDHRIAPSSLLARNLADAIALARDAAIPVRIDTYQPRYFDLRAGIVRDERYRWEDVVAAVHATLVETFSFARRSFGQPVTLAEVTTAVHTVPGVVAVDVDALHPFDAAESVPETGFLPAGRVVWGEDAEPSALAELLLVNPLGVTLTQKAVA
jgi:predicted phage baseplate assembly protein